MSQLESMAAVDIRFAFGAIAAGPPTARGGRLQLVQAPVHVHKAIKSLALKPLQSLDVLPAIVPMLCNGDLCSLEASHVDDIIRHYSLSCCTPYW